MSVHIPRLTTSHRHVFLINSRLGLFTAPRSHFLLKQVRGPLLANLRGHFAEFLNEASLERLRILSSPTCVGLRYGRLCYSVRGFSRQSLRALSPLLADWCTIALQCFATTDLPAVTTFALQPRSNTWQPCHSCVTTSLNRNSAGTGILTRFPSTTPLNADSP